MEGKKAPDFTFDLLAKGHELKFRKFRRHPTYLYFWDINNITAEDTAYIIRLHQTMGSRLNIVLLNYGDDPSRIKDFISANFYEWTHGVSSKEINFKYGVENLPYGFYIEKRKRIKQAGIKPKDLYEQLKK